MSGFPVNTFWETLGYIINGLEKHTLSYSARMKTD